MVKKYIVLSLGLVCAVMLFASPAARIGDRAYTEQELKDGFEAYLQYQNRASISPADSLNLLAQYFEELIGMYVYNKAIAEGMITVSEAELEQEVKNNAPAGIRALKDFNTDGKFDPRKYQKALQDNPEFKKSVMDFSRDVFGYRKLVQKIRSEAVIDSQKVRQDWLQKGNSADAKIIFFDYNKLSDIEATQEDARELYDANLEIYRRENGRSLRYVAFQGLNSRENAGKRAEFEQQSRALYELAVAKGLAEAAKELGYNITESPYFGSEDSIIRGIGRDAGLVNRVFSGNVGDLMELYHSPFGDIFIMEIASSVPEYYVDFEVEAQVLRLRARSLKRQEALKKFVPEFIRSHKSPDYLSEAAKAGFQIIEAKDMKAEDSLPGIGRVEALSRAILSTPEREFAPLVEQDGFYYLAWVEKRTARTERIWQAQKASILESALQEEQTRHLDEWYRARRDKLEIVFPAKLRR